MADKEATIYIVDLGRSMGQKRYGRGESDLDLALKYTWERISTTVLGGRKTTYIGVVGFGTDNTEHALSEEPGYENISVLLGLQQVLMPDIRQLRSKLRASETSEGDAMSAIVIGMEMIKVFTKTLKFIRRIVLVTDGRAPLDSDDNNNIAKRLIEQGIEITIVGVDFDDPNYGFKEEDKDSIKRLNESVLKSFIQTCGGKLITMSKALADMELPAIKPIRHVPTYKGTLTLGDTDKYEDASVSIGVERYARVMVAKATSAKYVVVKTDPGGPIDLDATQSTGTVQDGGMDSDLAAVKRARTYIVEDPEAPGGKRDVDQDELEKGFEYGRTAIHIGTDESNVLSLETDLSLRIVGFIEKSKFERFFEMDRTNYVVAARADERYAMAISSFVHALVETKSYAVARLVKKDNSKPVMLLLAPFIESGFECLIDVELPFAEDLRYYKFPPLDRVITISGKKIVEHRNLPSKDLKKAMSEYIDSMDLSDFGRDEEGVPSEYAKMEETYSPLVNRINQVIRHRAVYPDSPLPKPYSVLTKYLEPPSKLVSRSDKAIQSLINAADVKKVPAKQKGKFKRRRDEDKPLSGLDISSLLGPSQKSRKISSKNAIPEFKQALASSDNMGLVRSSAQQMGVIIEEYISKSVGDNSYNQALEALRVLRDELVEMEEPEMFNDFIKTLKEKIYKGGLGGERKEMWWKIRVAKLGLVDKSLSEVSKVSEEEAKEFYKVQSS